VYAVELQKGRKQMKTKKSFTVSASLLKWLKKMVLNHYQTVLVVLGFFLLWEILCRVLHVAEYVLPTPSSALAHLFLPQPDANYNWKLHISVTVYEFVISFVITGIVGVGLSIMMIWSKAIRNLLMPAFIFINSLPIIAIAPIILLWMGYGLKTNILIAFLISFFPVVVNTVTGLSEIDDDLLDLVRYLNAGKWQIFYKLRIPNALPYIFSGLKICTTMSVMGAIVGEFIASDRGLGYIIINSQYSMDTPPIFSSLIVISFAGAILYSVVVLFERLCMPWITVKEEL
jgi:NitT/TauT family transport system permease protein